MKLSQLLGRRNTRSSETASAPTRHRPELLQCETLQQYVAALLDLDWCRERSGASIVPVLRATAREHVPRPLEVSYETSPSYESVRNLTVSELVDSAMSSDVASRAAIFVLSDQDELIALGAAYSRVTARRLVATPDALAELGRAGPIKSVLVLALRSQLETTSLLAIQTRLRAACFRHQNACDASHMPPWGLLCAVGPTELSHLLGKTFAHQPQRRCRMHHVDFYGGELSAPIAAPELVVSDGTRYPDALCDLANMPAPDIVGLIGHSNSYCFHHATLCSGERDMGGQRRSCVAGFDCIFDAEPSSGTTSVFARELNSPIVFLGGCHSGTFQWPRGAQNLAEGLLCGAGVAVVTSHHVQNLSQTDPLLFHTLLARGMSVGEASQALNHVLNERLNFFEDSLILFGDPEVVACRDAEPVTKAEGVWSNETNSVTLALPETNRAALLLDIESSCLPHLGRRRFYIAANTTANVRAELVTLPSSRRHLFVINPQLEPLNDVRITLGTELEFDHSVLTRANQQLDSFDRWSRALDRLPEETTSQVADELLRASDAYHTLVESVASADLALCGLSYGGTVDLRLPVALQSLEDKIDSTTRRLSWAVLAAAIRLNTRGLIQTEFGLPQGMVSQIKRDSPCEGCGGEVIESALSLGFSRSVRRSALECLGCGAESNYPSHWPAPILCGPDSVQAGNTCELRLTLQHRGTQDVLVHTASFLFLNWVDLKKLDFDAVQFVEPPVLEHLLEAGQTWRPTLHLRTLREMPDHIYQIRVIIIMDGQLATLFHHVRIRRH